MPDPAEDQVVRRPDRPASARSSLTAPIELSEQEFEELRGIIREHTGISMSATKRQMVYRRLLKRLGHLRLESFSDYCEHLRSGDPTELEQFCNSVTTNLTSFFREEHHFEILGKELLPELIDKKRSQGKRLRFWSAGCSTGEEPYSLAIALLESVRDLAAWDIKILATDLDSNVLATAAAGIYPVSRVEKLPDLRLRRWFMKGEHAGEPAVRVRPALQDLITFKQLNLMQAWPMRGKFDVIFCRNVIIYFDRDTQRTLINRFGDVQDPGAFLLLGHSESLLNISDRYSLLRRTVYRKTKA